MYISNEYLHKPDEALLPFGQWALWYVFDLSPIFGKEKVIANTEIGKIFLELLNFKLLTESFH